MTPVITVQDLRDKYSFKFEESKNAYFEGLIDAATKACLQYLERDIGVAAFTHYADGGASAFVLEHTPVVGVQSVRVGGGILNESEYRLDPEAGVLYIYRKVPVKLDSIIVKYTAGWAVVPDDVKYCIALTVQYMAKLLQSNQAGVVSRSMPDGGTENLEQNLPPLAIQKHLSIYRRNKAR